MADRNVKEPDGQPSTARTEMFSDGVLAIAITLLILEIRVPEGEAEDLWHALGHLWPSYAAYAVSFLTIGIMWVNHNAIFDRVVHADRPLLYWNLLLLGTIAFLPFPTAVLARYIRDDHHASAAAFAYGLTMILIGFCFLGMLVHLSRHLELMTENVTSAGMRSATARAAFGPVTYGIATALALLAPIVSLLIFGVVAVFFALTRHPE